MKPYALPVVFCAALLCFCQSDLTEVKNACAKVDRLPAISPDYSGIVIPPAIAPLDFVIKEAGISFGVEISSKNGAPLSVISRGPAVHIPLKPWRSLLSRNRGGQLSISIFVRDSGGTWRSFRRIEDTIAAESMDRYVTYRSLSFLYNYSSDIRIYQRDLGSFEEKLLLNSNNFSWGCCNCHTPMQSDPNRFLVQVRSEHFGSEMLIADSGKLSTIGSRLGYASWHPRGGIIAFSVYKVQQCFHSVGQNFIDAYDNSSDLVMYDVKRKKITIVPQLHEKKTLETWPCWSADGKFLYFCSGPVLWTDFDRVPPENFDRLKYSLLRIAYDANSGAWGAIDTVLSAQKTGMSVSQPRTSPDGRYILCCMHAYGGYPHTQKSSDLYLLDLVDGGRSRLAVNSDCSESWHGWSSDSRWILFASKRDGGIFTRLYFSFVDSSGNAHKPFIMPQADPRFYDSHIRSYNVPEFAAGPVPFSERDFLRAVRSESIIKVPLPSKDSVPGTWGSPFIQ